tara:strand:+ start:6205 stop:6432 length:228 start_codon:yes stop_codon:yes gene_type:complete
LDCGNQIVFTLSETKGLQIKEKEFNFNEDGSPTPINIKRMIINIIEASNIDLKYEWIKPPSLHLANKTIPWANMA